MPWKPVALFNKNFSPHFYTHTCADTGGARLSISGRSLCPTSRPVVRFQHLRQKYEKSRIHARETRNTRYPGRLIGSDGLASRAVGKGSNVVVHFKRLGLRDAGLA